jgi:hypothetical protein
MCTTVCICISKRLRAIQTNEILLLLCLETCEARNGFSREVWFPFAAFASVATIIKRFFQAREKEPFLSLLIPVETGAWVAHCSVALRPLLRKALLPRQTIR